MNRKIVMSAVIAFSISIGIYASPADSIIAYPIPYNPGKGVMKFADTGGTLGSANVDITIYDINGDQVFSRSYVGFASTYWNGHNDAGTKVSPGLYIVKVAVEDAGGISDNKIIRILVRY